MKTMTRLAFLLAAGVLALSGCGGSDSGNQADTEAIEELVAGLNRANADRDGAAVCQLLQPSTFAMTFSSRSKCASETGQILKQAGESPKLVIEDISIEGETATVSFAGRSGEAPLVKEGGSWYLSLEPGTSATADDPATDATNATNATDDGDSGGGG